MYNPESPSMYDTHFNVYPNDPLNPTVKRYYPLKPCPRCGSGNLTYTGENKAKCKECGQKVQFDESVTSQIEQRNLLCRQVTEFMNKSQYKKAMRYLILAEKVNDKIPSELAGLSDIEMSAEIFRDQGELYLLENQPRKALAAYKKSVRYREEAARLLPNDISFYGLALCYGRMAEIKRDFDNPEWVKDWKKGLKMLKKALELSEDPDNASFLGIYLRAERLKGQD